MFGEAGGVSSVVSKHIVSKVDTRNTAFLALSRCLMTCKSPVSDDVEYPAIQEERMIKTDEKICQ